MEETHSSSLVWIVAILVIAILAAAVGYWFGTQKKPTDVTSTSSSTTTTTSPTTTTSSSTSTPATATMAKTYTNTAYSYSLAYDGAKYQLASKTTPTSINAELDQSGTEHWAYNVDVYKNTGNSPLQSYVDAYTLSMLQVKSEAIGTTAAATDATVKDVTVSGVAGKQISIKNFGDYGNSVVVLINNDNIYKISGDDEGQNAAAFATFLANLSLDSSN